LARVAQRTPTTKRHSETRSKLANDGRLVSIAVELKGVELRGRHGVEPDERVQEQLFVFHVLYEVGDDAASDVLSQTVDYREVLACVRETFESRSFRLLEALASAVADAICERFAVECVRVEIRKPGVELGVPVAYSAAVARR